MKAAIISLNSVSSQMIAKEMKNYFGEVDVLDVRNLEVGMGTKHPTVLYEGKPLPDYNCVYCRGSFRYASVLRAVTQYLQSNGCYLAMFPAAFTLGHDKALTHIRWETAGVPHPSTYLVATATAAKKVIERMKFPIVLKLPSGTHGKGVMVADSFGSASSMIDTLGALRVPFLIQEFIETGGVDVRAFVVGNRVIAGMRRVAEKRERRANIHAGGQGQRIAITDEIREIAIRAARAVGCDICAVDLLVGKRKTYALEINLSPGLQGISKVSNINIADAIAKHLYKMAKLKSESNHPRPVLPLKDIIAGVYVEGSSIMNSVMRGLKKRK